MNQSLLTWMIIVNLVLIRKSARPKQRRDRIFQAPVTMVMMNCINITV
jgi:hypothetical protein